MEWTLKRVTFLKNDSSMTWWNITMKISRKHMSICLKNDDDKKGSFHIDRFLMKKLSSKEGRCVTLYFDLNHPQYKYLPYQPISLQLEIIGSMFAFEYAVIAINRLMDKFVSDYVLESEKRVIYKNDPKLKWYRDQNDEEEDADKEDLMTWVGTSSGPYRVTVYHRKQFDALFIKSAGVLWKNPDETKLERRVQLHIDRNNGVITILHSIGDPTSHHISEFATRPFETSAPMITMYLRINQASEDRRGRTMSLIINGSEKLFERVVKRLKLMMNKSTFEIQSRFITCRRKKP